MRNALFFTILFFTIACTEEENTPDGNSVALEATFSNSTLTIENGTADVRVNPNGNDYISCVFKGFDPINSCWQQVESQDSFYIGISLGPVVLGEHYVSTLSQDVPFKIFWNTSGPPGTPLVVITTFDESQNLLEGYFVKDNLGMVDNCSGERIPIGEADIKFSCRIL